MSVFSMKKEAELQHGFHIQHPHHPNNSRIVIDCVGVMYRKKNKERTFDI